MGGGGNGGVGGGGLDGIGGGGNHTGGVCWSVEFAHLGVCSEAGRGAVDGGNHTGAGGQGRADAQRQAGDIAKAVHALHEARGGRCKGQVPHQGPKRGHRGQKQWQRSGCRALVGGGGGHLGCRALGRSCGSQGRLATCCEFELGQRDGEDCVHRGCPTALRVHTESTPLSEIQIVNCAQAQPCDWSRPSEV